MNGSVVFAITLVAIAQLVALVAGQARFYALCLDITLKKAYLFLLIPVLTILVVGVLLMVGILPASWSDDVFAISTLVAQLGLLYAVYKLMNGSCATSLKVERMLA